MPIIGAEAVGCHWSISENLGFLNKMMNRSLNEGIKDILFTKHVLEAR